jgi:hypothetical protein
VTDCPSSGLAGVQNRAAAIAGGRSRRESIIARITGTRRLGFRHNNRMPLTLEQSAALMNDQTLKGKVKVSMLRYCDTILIEADSTMGHTSRVRWAQQAMQQPEMWVNQLYPNVVLDPALQETGADTADPQIQAATEAVINKTV